MGWYFAVIALLSLMYHHVATKITAFTFEQKLDHFGSNSSKTFLQRYWIMDDFWAEEEGAPVMLFLGLAAPVDPLSAKYAGPYTRALKDHKALSVAIENRYYGLSLSKDMLKPENLKYLTFEQSLEDTVEIQMYIKVKFNIGNLAWLPFGASYSALKSVLHRIKYPDKFYAAFASSAPLGFKYDMPNYFGHVGTVILDPNNGGSQNCYDKVREAFNNVDSLLDKNDFDTLRDDFNICPGVALSDEKDKYEIARYISGLLADIDQNSFSKPGENPYARICVPFTRESSDPYEVLQRIHYETSPVQCSNISYQNMLLELNRWRDGIDNWSQYERNPGGRAWGFEICANFGFNAYCDPAQGCPLSKHVSMQGQLDMCKDAYGISEQEMKQASETFLKRYGGKHPDTTRLLLTHGAVDCGYPYEMTISVPEKEIYSRTTSYVGHVRDISEPADWEPVALYQTREFTKLHLAAWVNETRVHGSNSSIRLTLALSCILSLFLVVAI